MVLDTLPSRLLISFCLVILISLLRCGENAAKAVGESRLKLKAEGGSKRAAGIVSILREPGKLHNCIRFSVVFSELILAVFFAVSVSPLWGFSKEILNYGLSIIILGCVLLVISVYLPKKIAAKNPEKVVFSLSWLLFGAYYICSPGAWLLSGCANLLALPFGIKPNDEEEEVTEEEIRFMVDMGSENGAIDPEEKEMIHNIFELDDTPAESIMTHRTDVIFLWLEELEEWEEIINESNHSIYPVCVDSVDNVVGILYSRDFLRLLRRDDSITQESVKDILRQPYFVPESIKASDLFRKMQSNKTHFAVVLDEYGGLGGIISISDLLEEIVGNLDNEFDKAEEEEIVRLQENTWRIFGSADIDNVSETLGVELPVEEYNTFAGMILGELGTIPEDGTTVELEAFGLKINITKIDEHRIEETIVCKAEPKKEEKE